MHNYETLRRELRAALEQEPRVKLHRNDIRIAFTDGALVLEGEVDSIIAKKLAVKIARNVNGANGIVDRLYVHPAERRGDGAVCDAVCGFLLREPALLTCALRVREKGRLTSLRQRVADGGEIEISVADGIATLQGHVPSLSHKRLAGVLAWWAPGCCDVVNELAIDPGEDDNDDEITDALALVLEKDPLVHAGQLRVRTRNRIVTLHGWLATEEEKRMAELDAWYLFGVDEVINRIEVMY